MLLLLLPVLASGRLEERCPLGGVDLLPKDGVQPVVTTQWKYLPRWRFSRYDKQMEVKISLDDGKVETRRHMKSAVMFQVRMDLVSGTDRPSLAGAGLHGSFLLSHGGLSSLIPL